MDDLPPRSVYLLTLWLERPGGDEQPAVWRLSLEEARTGERRGFGTLTDLVDFLTSLMDQMNHPAT